MNTTYEPQPTSQSGSTGGFGFWKVLGIIAVALIVLALLGPILKGLFWIGLIALAVYGGYTLFRASRSKSGPKPPATF